MSVLSPVALLSSFLLHLHHTHLFKQPWLFSLVAFLLTPAREISRISLPSTAELPVSTSSEVDLFLTNSLLLHFHSSPLHRSLYVFRQPYFSIDLPHIRIACSQPIRNQLWIWFRRVRGMKPCQLHSSSANSKIISLVARSPPLKTAFLTLTCNLLCT